MMDDQTFLPDTSDLQLQQQQQHVEQQQGEHEQQRQNSQEEVNAPALQQQQHLHMQHAEQQQQPLPPPPQQQPAGEQQQEQSDQPAWQSYSSVFTNAKAGMAGVDQQKVKQVVYELSKDSAHFANEQRKQAQTDARIARLKAQAAQLSPAQLAAYQRSCDAKISLLEAGRDLSNTWLHIDMDAFYASVEERDNPSLKGKPMAVGGIGMICTANYVARTFGVRSAMPGFIAKKLCPQLIFVKPDFSKYTAASAEAFAVFRSYDERVQGASLDEAYLDATQYSATHGMTGEQVAAELRSKVVEATRGLTCSVGIAPNMMLAKVASDKNKPNGQCVVGASRDEVLAFIADLPIRKIPGVGKVTEQVLQALGVSTCSDLISHAALLTALLSDISSSSLIEAGLGLGATQHSSRGSGGGGENATEPGRKGISCERTFGAMSSAGEMEAMAESLVSHLAGDMASEGIEAKTLTLKLKTTAFEVRTRAVTLPTYVSTAAAMLPPLLRLLRAELPVEIRLMGVRGSNLRKAPLTLDKLAAAAAGEGGGGGGGRKLNALERLVLQGMQQQQQKRGKDDGEQQEQQQNEQQENGGVEHEQQQGQEQDQREQDVMFTEGVVYSIDSGSEPGGDDDDVEQHGEGGVGLMPPMRLLTQEQLQEHYEQQCWQQEQQQQQHQLDDLDAAHMQQQGVSGWQGAADMWEDGGGAPAAAAWSAGLAPHAATDAAGQMASTLDLQQQWDQQQQQQTVSGWGPEASACGVAASTQPSKKQRRSFQHPAQHVLAAAVQTEAASAAAAAAAPQMQQHQQHTSCAEAGVRQQEAGWQRASDFQQPERQQQQQQQQLWGVEQDYEADGGAALHTGQAVQPGFSSSTDNGRQGQHTNTGRSNASSSAPWTCQVCTFSDNEQKWLRCSVCETPKGDTQWAPPTALAGAAAAGLGGGAGSSLHRGRGGGSDLQAGRHGRGSRVGGFGGASTGGSSKQLTLEYLRLRRPSKG